MSYDAAPEIDDLYDPARRIAYDLSYSAQDRYQGKEVMFFEKNLTLPDVASPAKVEWRTVATAR